MDLISQKVRPTRTSTLKTSGVNPDHTPQQPVTWTTEPRAEEIPRRPPFPTDGTSPKGTVAMSSSKYTEQSTADKKLRGSVLVEATDVPLHSPFPSAATAHEKTATTVASATPDALKDPDETTRSKASNADKVDDSELAASLRPIYAQFISDLDLPPVERFESEKLMTSVLEAAAATGVPYQQSSCSYEALLVGYYYADSCFPYHSLDVKVYIAIYTWLATLCDDAEILGIVEDVSRFQERWLKGETQPTVLLRAFADQMNLSYQHWHPLVANLIVNASFAWLTTTALVARDGIKDKTTNPSKGGHMFPWYLRTRDGIGEGYAWFTFPDSTAPNLDVPIEAIEDMNRFITLTNDVLSLASPLWESPDPYVRPANSPTKRFYKEHLGGEKDNYIHKTAGYNHTNFIETLKETSAEVVACGRRVEQVLAGKGKYEKAWYFHKTGYVHFHITRSRYRLWQLGIGEKPAAN